MIPKTGRIGCKAAVLCQLGIGKTIDHSNVLISDEAGWIVSRQLDVNRLGAIDFNR
jgi:hypothetical protein